MKQHDFNIYVGAETGVLKGININEKNVIVKNFHNLVKIEKQQEICSMAWGDAEEVDILLGIRSQKVRTYDSEFNGFSGCMETPAGEGPINGLARLEGALVTASESGTVKLWKTKQKESIEIQAGGPGKNISRMKQNPVRPEVIATGGKENGLQLWDLSAPEKPLFRSKNVPHDMLDLRVPIWISDIAFLPNSERVATTSRHSHIRVYSPKEQLRPVIDFNFLDEPLTCISTSNRDHEIIVGTGRGRMALFDLRQKKMVQSFKGIVGSIKGIACHETRPYVASVSLDRHLRIHDVNSKKLLFKVYLKSRLSCILMRSSFTLENFEEPEVKEELKTPLPVENEDGVEQITLSDDENDDIWSNMQSVAPDSKKAKYI